MSEFLGNKKHFSLKKDLTAGLIVFLIALPLCLGIAQASEAPLFSGIIAGVVGGVVIGFFSKSQLSVSGPAAGLVAIVAGSINDLGGMEMFGLFLCAVVIAGFFQILLGFLKAGSIATFFPSSVIEGMLAGIGLTIIFKQLPDAFGYAGPDDHTSAGIRDGERGINFDILRGITEHIEVGAIIISVLGVLLLALWDTKAFRKVKALPVGLLVVVIGTVLGILFNKSGVEALTLENQYFVQLKVPENAADFISQFRLPDFSGFTNPMVWQVGALIAVIASIESLLCVEATDKLDPQKRNTPGNSELKAQGIGNMVSGLLGGLPITSVIVRSSANINAGATSKISAIFHGILLLVCVATIPFILNLIPKAALAAILLYTGFRLTRPSQYKHMYKVGRTEFIPFLVTAVAVALPFLGLLKGVMIGMLISIFYLLRSNMRIPFFYNRIKTEKEDVTVLELAQEVSFLNKGSIKRTLDALPEGSIVVLDASKTQYIDHDVLEVIREFHEAQAPYKNITVSLVGFKNVYKVPESDDEAERIANEIQDADNGKRSAGKYKKLLKELEN